MQWRLLFMMLFFSHLTMAQRGMMFLKKKGYKKVMTFAEGGPIQFKTKDQQVAGYITLIKNDSLRVNGQWFRSGEIRAIILRGKDNGAVAPLLLTTAGVAISTAGMTLAKWGSFKESLAYSTGIGYGNFLITILPKLKRKKYRIGKKFTLHTLDLHF